MKEKMEQKKAQTQPNTTFVKKQNPLANALTPPAKQSSVNNSDQETVAYIKRLRELTGTGHKDLAEYIIEGAAFSLCVADKAGIMVQSLDELKPQDLHEARLCAQATALYAQGIDFLERARRVLFDDGTFAKDHWHTIFMKTATKLLDLHTKTVAEIVRYRQKGEQKIIVQHVNVCNGGKAVVNGSYEGGDK